MTKAVTAAAHMFIVWLVVSRLMGLSATEDDFLDEVFGAPE